MKYRVNCGGANKLYGIKEKYNAGEIVRLKIPFMTDTNTYVKSVDVHLTNVTSDSRYYEYEFVMPEKDVNIAVENSGSMMNVINPNLPNEPVSMSNIMTGMMNNTFVNKKSNGHRVYCNMPNSLIGMDDYYLPNVVVRFSFIKATDTSYHIVSDDVDISYDDSAYGYIRGIFIMPDHDVNINISSSNIMTMPFQQQVEDEKKVADGVPKVCPCCNETNKSTAKFCFNCGAVLK